LILYYSTITYAQLNHLYLQSVESLQHIIESYQESTSVKKLITAVDQEDAQKILLEGTSGSQAAFIIESFYRSNSRYMLVIAQDKEAAAYLQNDLASLHKRTVHFFPDSFKSPRSYSRLNNTQVLQRTEVINRITANEDAPDIIVAYPESLFELVVAPQELSSARLYIKKSESLDVDTIIEVLVEYGFERVDFVYEPGQFSIRGGIVDIFSYGNEWPYRIELFDDEVESIRTFDPSTQLSKQEIGRITIIPNINTRFGKEQKVSLLEVLPQQSLIWIAQPGILKDRLQECGDAIDTFSKNIGQLEDEQLKRVLKENAFVDPVRFIEHLSQFNLIYLKDAQHVAPADLTVSFQSKPQPDFNKNFKLLIENLKTNESQGITNFIVTENTRQVNRLQSIFDDLEAKVLIHTIAIDLHAGFIDAENNIALYTDHQIFQRYHRFKLRKGFTKDKALSLKMIKELSPGDFVVHIDHGVGKFSGMEKININGHNQESVRLLYQNNDVLYVGINSLHKISKYSGKEGKEPKLNKLGSDAWKRLKAKTKKKVKDIAGELIKLYAKRTATPGYACDKDGYLQAELEASFIYEDTPDQYTATQEVKADMEKPHPMDRLICGDVGFGKTEVAIRAAFKAVVNGKQVAVLVPTTILALQHYKTFKDRLTEFGVEVDYVNRFRTTGERNKVFKACKDGEVDILIGTHSILNKKSGFKDLGLLIIDEEQKFGVSAKEKLRNLKVNVDTLTLTATPIPRTLSFSLMSARDLSLLKTPPPNRRPIHTEIRIFNHDLIKEAIYYETTRGGQVFFVHNRVKTLPEITQMVKQACPDLDIAMAHGQMESKALEQTLADFIDFKFDVLVCTNIIETGLDIPNANTIIINNAHQFGMSDLHQLRGRVGRSNKKAFCYLFCPPLSTLTTDARKRLTTLEEFSDLGDGFNIAMRDLDIRGAGNLLGAEQSGFINEIGYTTYQKILKEAIQELKENEFKEVFQEELSDKKNYVEDVIIETDEEMLIPDDYVTNIQERLNLYTELDTIEDEEGIKAFREQLIDRFGPLPKEVNLLFEGLRLRWLSKRLGFERILIKNRKLRCYFISDPQSSYFETDHFRQMMSFLSKEGHRFGLTLKQSKRYLIVVKDDILNMRTARKLLDAVYSEVFDKEEVNT